ncbi:MAG: hypothetical protein ACOZF0_24085 [Thermodesulfobacteriota bacterium]
MEQDSLNWEDDYRNKLNWEKVKEIRKMYKESKGGYKKLAENFGVSVKTIRTIVRGESSKVQAEKDCSYCRPLWMNILGERNK